MAQSDKTYKHEWYLRRKRDGLPPGRTMEIVCPRCGTVARKSVSQVNTAKKHGRQVYCGRKCFGESLRKAVKSKNPLVRLRCEKCGKEFDRIRHQHSRNQRNGVRTTCSTACGVSLANSRPKIECACHECGARLYRHKSDINDRVFCSHRCACASRRYSDEQKRASADREKERMRQYAKDNKDQLRFKRFQRKYGQYADAAIALVALERQARTITKGSA